MTFWKRSTHLLNYVALSTEYGRTGWKGWRDDRSSLARIWDPTVKNKTDDLIFKGEPSTAIRWISFFVVYE